MSRRIGAPGRRRTCCDFEFRPRTRGRGPARDTEFESASPEDSYMSRQQHRRMSRRMFLGTAASTAALALGAAPSDGAPSPQTPARPAATSQSPPDQTIVFVNGRIHTMD